MTYTPAGASRARRAAALRSHRRVPITSAKCRRGTSIPVRSVDPQLRVSPNWGSMLATAGGLVFSGGTNDRKIHAFDASNGKLLWESVTNSGILAPPTYVHGRWQAVHRGAFRLGRRRPRHEWRPGRLFPGKVPEPPEGGGIWVFAFRNGGRGSKDPTSYPCVSRFRIDGRWNLVPDLDLVPIGIGEEHVGLSGHELAATLDRSASLTDRGFVPPMSLAPLQAEAEVHHATCLACLARLALEHQHVAASRRLRLNKSSLS